ncbi:MAG: hypothetical protein K1X67_26590 [Fimbriimonadaceae bacterium]|nr:hypothetical protein [Fimbriimonadaceae bacterium]
MELSDLLGEVAAEIDAENERAMTPEERTYHGIAQKLLLLERDLRAPGTARSADERIDRLLEVIAKESF